MLNHPSSCVACKEQTDVASLGGARFSWPHWAKEVGVAHMGGELKLKEKLVNQGLVGGRAVGIDLRNPVPFWWLRLTSVASVHQRYVLELLMVLL